MPSLPSMNPSPDNTADFDVLASRAKDFPHSLPETRSSRNRDWFTAIAIAAALALLYTAFAAGTTLWDRDEPRYARTAVETLQGGDWLVPHLNDQPRLRKPPLIYWIMAPFAALMGPTTLALRMCSIITMIAAAILTFLIGRRMFNADVGLWAMTIFGTTGLTIFLGSAAMIDATMIFFTTAAIAIFIDAVFRRSAWWHWPILFICFAAIALLKGPLVWPIPLLAAAGAAIIARSEVRLPKSWWFGMGACAIAGLIVLAAWAFPANQATDGALFDVGLRQHVLKRLATGMEGHGSNNLPEYILLLPIYFPAILLVFFPWTLHLPGAVRSLLSSSFSDRRRRAILIAAIIPWFVLISLTSTKLLHYPMPILPFLAILTAATMDRWRSGPLTRRDRTWLKIGIWMFAIPATALVLTVAALPWALERPGIRITATISALAFAVWAAVAIYLQSRERIVHSSLVLAAALPPLLFYSLLTWVPVLEDELKVSADVSAFIHERFEPTGPLYMMDYDEPSLFFYLNRPPGFPIIRLKPREVADWALGRKNFAAPPAVPIADPHDRREPGGALIIGQSKLREIEANPRYVPQGSLPLRIVWQKPVIDYSKKGRHDTILVVVPETGE